MNIKVKDFLQHFGAGDKALLAGHQFLQPTPDIGLVGIWSANQIHRNVRVDKDHGCMPDP
jgi:hypothetical protein